MKSRLLILVCAAPLLARGAAVDRIPDLDEMAGDWIPMAQIANPPAVHNFNQMLVVGRDLTSYYCNPGGLFTHTRDPAVQWRAGYPLVRLTVNGVDFPASEARCFAYRALRRNRQCSGMTVETDTRMVNEQRGVLCRIIATNPGRDELEAVLAVHVPGRLLPDAIGVGNATQRPGVLSIIRPSSAPASVAIDHADVVWTWRVRLRPEGKLVVGFVAGDGPFAPAGEIDARVSAWAAHFDATMDECERVWKQRWSDAFTPGNRHFSGNLPVLVTSDPGLARNYYMGVQTMLALERTQFPVASRSFITSGERADGIQYYWDASMQATAWALLEPRGMRATLRRWLVQNPRSGAHFSLQQVEGYDATRYDKITGYAFNACTIFATTDTYLRVTGDRQFLNETLEDGATVLQRLDALATDGETLPKGPQGLSDYGRNGNLLECAPNYTHCVPSLNAQAVWMLRHAAGWLALSGQATRAALLRNQADALLPAVLGLYQPGDGVWNTCHDDGKKVELRHCVDFIYVGGALQDDLSARQKSEMIAFVRRELLMRDWMRAMSLRDVAAPLSDRPDHGPMGAYDGWIPLTAATMWKLGDPQAAYAFFCRTAQVTQEGPFAQAHEFYGPDKSGHDAPVRVAERRGCMKECISGAAFADAVISTFFGFSPSPDGRAVLVDPKTPRPFRGTLTGVRLGGALARLTASPDGIAITPLP